MSKSKKEMFKKILIAVLALCVIAAMILPMIVRADAAIAGDYGVTEADYDAETTEETSVYYGPGLEYGAFGQVDAGLRIHIQATAENAFDNLHWGMFQHDDGLIRWIDLDKTVPVLEEDEKMEKQNYKVYTDFMFENMEENKNALFSIESLRIAFDMYRNLLPEEEQVKIIDFLDGTDCLHYQGTDVFKIVNRLWVNQNKTFNLPEENAVSPFVYRMDMSDSTLATLEKDVFVAEQTNGFIQSTPTVLGNDTVIDAMNILYFKDKWKDGDKNLTEQKLPFFNADGTTTDTYRIYEYGDTYLKGENANAYTMMYDDGFLFTIVLPDEGVAIRDVDINSFLNQDVKESEADVYLEMPEFEINSEYSMDFSGFGLDVAGIDKNIHPDDTTAPQITQIDRICVDHEGTEAAAITEIILETMAAYDPMEKEHVDIICDRPFFFFITDTVNEDIAFMGIVNELQE